ncbi:Pyruvate:ferredoxin oxidoreductase-related 2-oxoacid:ferredoxin oxidoreductase, alpha subunit [Archaeoglobus sulfaticallidus PM70-1]|uniref:Pyruvate:ferredoxin oxidoreductase-related 2-oxoacid:ferredoxin oxidoreductase, alpha subunit n=1 Tax=Archaeoglobus sulfaticallidus PM70-1 TaxID=387631 RepID=N0BF37_9EURY|nr:2-oxoacid:ferredoxin oxidoreductase subunit alpha [Archaeoglobus sulfaticallidus]AGK60887.1 Pyruvate:ferredoxin oxidoreductase-related 2-oxoacid:ferredoxin oxidoreductase, alpha subunit [Archaeoglobus sulfaticallidus PM70-1]
MFEVLEHREKLQTKILTGNEASAYAAMNAKVRFVAGYPITPATSVIETISKLIDEGKMKARFVAVESEHSAMSACVGASYAGLRTFTATSSHGLAYMHEMLHFAVNARTPVVMAVANRAIGPGWNIWSDLSDSLSQRDTGWLQFYCSDIQEIYDTIAMAYRIAEQVMLPVMVCYDGFVLSHSTKPIEVTPLDGFIEERDAEGIDFDNPTTFGNISPPESYFSLRKAIHKAVEGSLDVIGCIEQEFLEYSNRYTPMLCEGYFLDDAEKVMVSMGAVASEARVAVDLLRDEGEKWGLLKVKSFKPLPKKIIKAMLSGKEVFVIDRSLSPGTGGILHHEMSSILGDVNSAILGLGGVDVTAEAIVGSLKRLRGFT